MAAQPRPGRADDTADDDQETDLTAEANASHQKPPIVRGEGASNMAYRISITRPKTTTMATGRRKMSR